jgi:hypothetical protein
MRGRIAVGLLVLSLLAPARAEACHTGVQIGRIVFGLGAVLVDTPLVIHDLAVDRASRGYGVLEAALTAPQIAIALSLRAEENEECGDASGTVGDQAGSSVVVPLMLVASTALFAHAVYVFVRPGPSSQPKPPPTVGFMPLLVTDRGEHAGITMSVAF